MSVLSQYRVNTHNSLFTLLQFDSLLWYFVWSDLIVNTFLNSSSPLSITKHRGARGIPLSSKSKKRGKTCISGTPFLHVSLPAFGYAWHLGLVLPLWNNGFLSHSQINKISNLPLIGKQTSLFVHRWHLYSDNKSLWAFQFGVSSRNVWKIPGDTFISSGLALPLTKSLIESDDGFKLLLLPLR